MNLKEVEHEKESSIPLANLTYLKDVHHIRVLGYAYLYLHIYIWYMTTEVKDYRYPWGDILHTLPAQAPDA